MLRTLMSRSRGRAYPVDDDWRRRVRDVMDSKGWSQADLAREVPCSPSVISELLSGKSNESPLIPEIHTALGWSPPHVSVLAPDTEELLALWQKLDERRKARLLERAGILAEDVAKDGKKRT